MSKAMDIKVRNMLLARELAISIPLAFGAAAIGLSHLSDTTKGLFLLIIIVSWFVLWGIFMSCPGSKYRAEKKNLQPKGNTKENSEDFS